MDPIVTSILCSLFADTAYDAFKSMFDLNKTVESKLQQSFEKALREWSVSTKDREKYDITDFSQFLKYLDPKVQSESEEIKELIDLWKEEILKDDLCSRYILHLKIDQLLINTEKDPKDEITEEEFRKNNDRNTVKLLLEAFDFDMMHEFCCSDPELLNQDIPTCCDIWGFIIASPTYRIYDQELENLINSVFEPWSKAIELGMYYYYPSEGTRFYKFHRLSNRRYPSKEAEAAYHKIIELKSQIYPHLRPLANHIKDYLCLDPSEYAMKGFTFKS